MTKQELLKTHFGYDTFREGQESVVESILEHRDVLAIMPTGAGKSICYQVPALTLSGITIVISPLISLMQDQVKALNEAGIHAAFINSSLSESQISKALCLFCHHHDIRVYQKSLRDHRPLMSWNNHRFQDPFQHNSQCCFR